MVLNHFCAEISDFLIAIPIYDTCFTLSAYVTPCVAPEFQFLAFGCSLGYVEVMSFR